MDRPIADLAIIIPTLNEQDYIGKLLDSIITQTVQPKEVVIVDAESPDNTLSEIIKRQDKLPLKVLQIPKDTISRQRNTGARSTFSKHLLFLDADMVLKDPKTLEKYLGEIEGKVPDVASAFNYPLSDSWKDKYFFFGMNTLFKAAKPIWPMTVGMNLYLTRETFEKVKGFDDKVKVGEDMELVQRVVKKGGKFIFLNRSKLYTSVRRFQKEGRTKYTLKMVHSFINVLTKGYRNNSVKYEFGKFKEDNP